MREGEVHMTQRHRNAAAANSGASTINMLSSNIIAQCFGRCPIIAPEWNKLGRRTRRVAIAYFWLGVGFGLEQAERQTAEEEGHDT